MKKYIALLIALLLIIVPITSKAEDGVVIYEDEEIFDDPIVVDYDDEDDFDYEEDEEYYFDDSYIMEAETSYDYDDSNLISCNSGEKKLFTSNNIIFLAVGVVTGAALTIVAVVCTRGKCNCNCGCNCEEKEEKKKVKKNDK